LILRRKDGIYMDRFERVCHLAAELLPEAIDFAQRLVRCPSLGGDEKGAADICIKEMKKLGYDDVFRDEWGNVIGIVNGLEPGPTILYNGHLDHVPPGDLSLWGQYSPYGGDLDTVAVDNRDCSAQESAQVIHGRGVMDLKGAVACQIYGGKLLLRLRHEGIPLQGRYIVTAVCLEEPGDQVGTIQLLDDTFKKMGWEYDGLVSCEPSSLDIALGHRGRVEPLVRVHGKISHGSAPWLGINAVYKANKFIDKVANELPHQFPSDPDLGRSSIALTIIKASPGELCIVPERCDINFDRRFVPGETPESCIQELQDIADQLAAEDAEFKADVGIAEAVRTFYTGKSVTIANKKSAWKIPQEHPFVQAMAEGLAAVGQEVRYKHWYFGTDLSKVVGDDRKPALGYGPGQEQYAHVPVEKLRTDYMQQSIAGYAAGFLKLMQLPKQVFRI
jgi:putative selenium metabolism hydrolase